MGVEQGPTRGNDYLKQGWLKKSLAEGTLGWKTYKTLEKWVYDVGQNPEQSTDEQLEDLKERIRPYLQEYKEYLFGTPQQED